MKLYVAMFSTFIALFAAPAFGYIDPGSGSVIMSAVIGFFVAMAIAVKGYWYKIKSFFGRSKPKDGNEAAPSDNS